MSTRLVERLEREIAQCADPFERECLKAQHAAAIARLGQLDHARFVLAGLKTQARRHDQPTLHAWVHFVDATIHYFGSIPSASARAGFEAARDRAVEGGDTQLQALACAWLAAVDMQGFRDEKVLEALTQALGLASPSNHAALARAWVVMANLADYAGEFEDSMRWYERARVHAVADGDSTTVSLMMYNRVNSLISHHVRKELFGTPAHTAIERVMAEMASTSNLEIGLGATALASFSRILRAEALTVVGCWPEAVALIDQFLDHHVKEAGPLFGVRFLAHRAWCHANLKAKAQALADLESVVELLPQVVDEDDLAVVHQRVANTCELLGMCERSVGHRTAAAQALEALAEAQKLRQARLRQFQRAMKEMGYAWPQD